VFQLILPFQLDLPFEAAPEAARSVQSARVRRSRVRSRKGRALAEVVQAGMTPAAEAE
jgi:hypothetical protein